MRARDYKIPFDGQPGPNNAITDVAGVEVGYTTLISDHGPVRTGVTAILPRGRDDNRPVQAGFFSLNGNGEMTGTIWIEESGMLSGPVMITNTHSVGVVRDSVIAWQMKKGLRNAWSLPVVAETYDGLLNDINGFHVHSEHVFAALDSAAGGPIAEGNAGGGTGMICHGFKGGTGTSSRVISNYRVGVLVQANHGQARRLTIAGIPVGRELNQRPAAPQPSGRTSSIIVIIATDTPLLPGQLKALAKRATIGVGIVGGLGETTSGDIFLAFSTGNSDPHAQNQQATYKPIEDDRLLNSLYEAVVQATEEAIVNALVAAKTMTGRDGHTVRALPIERVQAILQRYNRLL